MFCRCINGVFFHYANLLQNLWAKLCHTLLKRVEVYHEVIYVKSRFRLIFEVQPVARESQALVCVLSELQWFR